MQIFKREKLLNKNVHLAIKSISLLKLKENFFKRNNTLLNLTIPTENMLAWAIMSSNKKIGDPSDQEMRVIEIEEYLKNYLANPDINNSICDKHALKYYIKKSL